MGKHAFLSASGAPAWTRCEAKVWREKGLPDETSAYAEEGTRAHELFEQMVTDYVYSYDRPEYEAPSDMVAAIKQATDFVFSVVDELEDSGHGNLELYTEVELDISGITFEADAKGTADLVLVGRKKLVVIDLKYGRGVKVEAEGNEQLLIYGHAALDKYDLLGEVESVDLIIAQPRLNHYDTWTLTRQDLSKYTGRITGKAVIILAAEGGDRLSATPGEKQCKFCKVRATCPEYRATSLAIVTNDDFVDLTKEDEFLENVKNATELVKTSDDKRLATCWSALEMIENWCKAVRTEVENRALSGTFTDGRIKVVQGKRGNREWIDETEAYATLSKHLDDDFIFEKKIKTPTKIKDAISKKDRAAWEEIEEHVTQKEGRPIVVASTDKRPAMDLNLEFKPITDDIEFTEALVGLTKED